MKLTLILNSIVITLFSVLFFSCNRENKCTGVNYSYLTKELRDNLFAPHTGTDTLKFLYNNKDTQIYVGQGAQQDWQLVPGGDPSLCDSKYEKLIYTYNCINATGFTFRLEYHKYGGYSSFLFKNVNVGEYKISAIVGDSISINNNWYYEPYYRANGPDTIQYFMFCTRSKNPNVGILKIKYVNTELTRIE